MIKIPYFDGFDYELTDYSVMLDYVRSLGFDEHRLRDSAGGREIYGFSLGDIYNKPVMYMEGCIHNIHEWRTFHWVSKFMEILSNPSGYPNQGIIEDLKARYSFYFIPCVSPDNYGGDELTNVNGVNVPLNFDFMWEEKDPREGTGQFKGYSPFSEPEAKNVRDVVLDLKPVSFIDTHSWGDNSGYMVRHPHNRSIDLLLNDYYKSIGLTTEIKDDTDSRFDHIINQPTAYNWAGEQISSRGTKIIASVLETGTRDSHYEQAKLGVNGLFLNCVHVDHYLTTGNMTLS